MDAFSDFRSDTVTRPTPNMRKAMAEALVGDDVLGDDPMGNSVSVKVWTKELDEVIIEERSHIYNMESTHMTFISRVTPRPLPSSRGAMDPDEVEKNIRQPSVHIPRTSLICVENTHNNWSGAVVPMENLKAIREVADKYEIKVHFDGARIFNASAASGISVREYAAIGDSLMFCLSKGLSAPVGSLLAGTQNFIDYARRVRKALGGGMRQVGILAAAGIVALNEMIDRLKEDHERAKKLALAIAGLPGIELDPENIHTNIIIFGFNHPKFTIPAFLEELKKKKILALETRTGIRFVTHKDVTDEDVDRTVVAFSELLVD